MIPLGRPGASPWSVQHDLIVVDRHPPGAEHDREGPADRLVGEQGDGGVIGLGHGHPDVVDRSDVRVLGELLSCRRRGRPVAAPLTERGEQLVGLPEASWVGRRVGHPGGEGQRCHHADESEDGAGQSGTDRDGGASAAGFEGESCADHHGKRQAAPGRRGGHHGLLGGSQVVRGERESGDRRRAGDHEDRYERPATRQYECIDVDTGSGLDGGRRPDRHPSGGHHGPGHAHGRARQAGDGGTCGGGRRLHPCPGPGSPAAPPRLHRRTGRAPARPARSPRPGRPARRPAGRSSRRSRPSVGGGAGRRCSTRRCPPVRWPPPSADGTPAGPPRLRAAGPGR